MFAEFLILEIVAFLIVLENFQQLSFFFTNVTSFFLTKKIRDYFNNFDSV